MPVLAPPAPHRSPMAPEAGDGDVLVCPGCGAEVRIRRRDDGHTHTTKELTCPSCGTELVPSPETDEPGTTRTVGARGAGPWSDGGWRRIA